MMVVVLLEEVCGAPEEQRIRSWAKWRMGASDCVSNEGRRRSTNRNNKFD